MKSQHNQDSIPCLPSYILMKKDANITIHLEAETIDNRINELAEKINKDYKGKKVILVGLMKGCLFFLADIARKLDIDVEIEIVYAVSYYGSKSSTGNVEILLDIRKDIYDCHILVVDDIVDTGLTLNKIKDMLLAREPLSVEFCVLFDKHECRLQEVDVKYIGFKLPTMFYIGYGMDYKGRYRELPCLAVLNDD